MIEQGTWILGLVVVGAAVAVWSFIPRQRRRARFAGREDLSFDTIYNRYFATNRLPKEYVRELWTEVAQPLGVPFGKLRPSDRFDDELAPVAGWELDDDSVELDWAAERRLKKLGVSADLSEIRTLQDYVEFFCKLEMQKQ